MSQKRKYVSTDLLQRIKNDEALALAIATGMQKKIRTVLVWIDDELKEKQTPLSSDAVALIIKKYDETHPQNIMA